MSWFGFSLHLTLTWENALVFLSGSILMHMTASCSINQPQPEWKSIELRNVALETKNKCEGIQSRSYRSHVSENCSSIAKCNCSSFPPLETAKDMNFIRHFQCWMMYSQNNIIKGCVSVLGILLFMIAALWQTQHKTQINYSSLCMRFSPQCRIQKYPLWYWLKKEACACKPIFLLPACVKEQKKLQ